PMLLPHTATSIYSSIRSHLLTFGVICKRSYFDYIRYSEEAGTFFAERGRNGIPAAIRGPTKFRSSTQNAPGAMLIKYFFSRPALNPLIFPLYRQNTCSCSALVTPGVT
ncbi:hypothetical protein, partial [Enterocloster citroniae]|uniref:hypothetical protein n=1 Tax=Enterocloster citroniae TaxID=358743 RepID=UPI0034A4BB1E